MSLVQSSETLVINSKRKSIVVSNINPGNRSILNADLRNITGIHANYVWVPSPPVNDTPTPKVDDQFCSGE